MGLPRLSWQKNWFLGASFLIAAIVCSGAFVESYDSRQPASLKGPHYAGTAASRAEAGPFSAESGDLQHRLGEAYGRLPLTFEANQGQTDPRVEFLARGPGYTLFLTPTEAVFSLARHPTASTDTPVDTSRAVHSHLSSSRRESAVLRMQLVGSNPAPSVKGHEGLQGKAHYFLGNDPTKWRTNVPTFARVNYANVYPGVDLTFYGNQRQLEYDFIVHPGADPRRIALRFEGARAVELDATGDLVLHTPCGAIRQHTPRIYQDIDGRRQVIAGGYVLRGRSTVGFDVGAYDISRALVIDPTLEYSTYLGGSDGDSGSGIALDAAGSAYITGGTLSADFPTTPGAFDPTSNSTVDAFVTKLDATGSALVYSTYLGGSAVEEGRGIAVDAAGSAYVTGITYSANLPTTPGAFDPTYNSSPSAPRDAFVTKLNAAGSALVYSTYLGGSRGDEGQGIAVDAVGSTYVTGFTDGPFFPPMGDFPTTPGAFDTSANGLEDVFVTKLNAAGSALVYSTYLGGEVFDQGYDIAVDAAGRAYVTGYTSSGNRAFLPFPITPGAFDTTFNGGSYDAFVTTLNAAGSALVYSTYLGGSGTEIGYDIAVDAASSAYVTGLTGSANFPTTPEAFDTTINGADDAFLTKLNAPGSALVYSTYLGGSGVDQGSGVAIDAAGSAYVTGVTTSANFPTKPEAFDITINSTVDAFLTKLNAHGSALVYSTYLGGSGNDSGSSIAVDAAGSAYVTGGTNSADFPTTPGAFDTTFNGSNVGFSGDAFVTKIADVGPPATLTLTPPAASNPVETQHCVTATVRNAGGNPVPDITVPFIVIGAVTTSGSGATDQNGEATFCYMGPPLPGADAITAYADTDNNNTQDLAEPSDAATKTWTGWTFCAPEGGVCAFTGTIEVRYGATGAFVYKTLTDGTACTNDVFGDPIYGTVKACAISGTPPPSEWTVCASESWVCAFTGTMEVRYGVNGAFVYRTLTDGTACANEVFGDPIYGSVKYCATRIPPPPTDWTFCASEGGVCAFTGTMEVRYGVNGAFVYRTLTDGTACTNEVFGDPIYGVVKSCESSNRLTIATAPIESYAGYEPKRWPEGCSRRAGASSPAGATLLVLAASPFFAQFETAEYSVIERHA